MNRQKSTSLGERPPSTPSGVRGHLPKYGKHRTRTARALGLARHLRKKSTDAEKRLWRLLRDHRFDKFKFRRQYPCGNYFLDFYCAIAKFAVELDGGGHGFPDQRAKDQKRNQFLETQGIRVLRFWNHKLSGELEAVRFEIWQALMERTGHKRDLAIFSPRPGLDSLSPLGERVGVRGTRPSLRGESKLL